MWPWGSSGQEIRSILRREQPDLVEISDKYTLPVIGGLVRVNWLPGVSGRPAVVGTSHERLHDNMAVYLKLGPVGNWMSRIFLKRYYWLMFDHHIANSTYTAEELLPASTGHRVPRYLHVLPMGVDCSGLDPANRGSAAKRELAAKLGIDSACGILLYVGRLAKEKNLPLLVEMMGLLASEYHLVIAGEGKLRPWLETYGNRRTGNRIHLLGHLRDKAALSGLHAGADVFVHPNPSEPFGIAPLEAMAAGVPLVAPDRGGVLSYANARNAWLSDPDASEFARTVQEVFANPALARSRAAAGRETALSHDWSHVAQRYFELYDRIMSERTVIAARVQSLSV
jgi:alpha-1,6-mannosyltransferase